MNLARTELHLHLDGSFNIRWAYEKSLQRQVIPKETSFRDYYNMLFENNTKPHAQSINKFALTCSILQDAEDLAEAAWDLVRRLHADGIWYAEIRFASQQHMDKGLSQKEALAAVIEGAERGMKDFPGITVGIINCMMHKGDDAYANWQENLDAIEATKAYLGKGAVGIDLAGYENNGDFRLYAPLIEKARSLGIPCTVHAGEMGIGEHVMDAIDMGASRLGHGVNCVENEIWLNRVLKTQIPLEVCVTSNVKRTMNYAEHAILTLLEKGANVTLNSDNMMFARTCARNEHDQLRMLGVSDAVLEQCTRNAFNAAFCDEDTKQMLHQRLDDYIRTCRESSGKETE